MEYIRNFFISGTEKNLLNTYNSETDRAMNFSQNARWKDSADIYFNLGNTLINSKYSTKSNIKNKIEHVLIMALNQYKVCRCFDKINETAIKLEHFYISNNENLNCLNMCYNLAETYENYKKLDKAFQYYLKCVTLMDNPTKKDFFNLMCKIINIGFQSNNFKCVMDVIVKFLNTSTDLELKSLILSHYYMNKLSVNNTLVVEFTKKEIKECKLEWFTETKEYEKLLMIISLFDNCSLEKFNVEYV